MLENIWTICIPQIEFFGGHTNITSSLKYDMLDIIIYMDSKKGVLSYIKFHKLQGNTQSFIKALRCSKSISICVDPFPSSTAFTK